MPGSGTRVPHIWGDALGTVGVVLNQEARKAEPGEPMSPGVSPGTSHFIVNYQPYTPLADWEAMKAGLPKEPVPHVRHSLRDYFTIGQALPQEMPPLSVQTGDASPQAAAEGVEPEPSARAMASTMAQLPRRTAPPRDDFERHQPSEISPARAAARMLVQTPRAGTRREAPPVVQYPELDSPPVEPPSPRYKLFGEDPGPFYDEANIKVSRVKGNAMVGKNDEYQRRPTPERKRKVTDRDKAQFPRGRDMRPARKLNLESKKRLNDLLQMPAMGIDAGDIHPSRAYRLVPAQNVRVV